MLQTKARVTSRKGLANALLEALFLMFYGRSETGATSFLMNDKHPAVYAVSE